MTFSVAHRPVFRRSSDLSRHSAEVFSEAEKHPVTVTRRDGEPLVLMSQREAEARDELLNLAAHLTSASIDGGPIEERLAKLFPWMLALTPEGRAECARALLDASRASFATGQPHLALTELASWRESATAIAAGLGTDPVEWLDDAPSVERP